MSPKRVIISFQSCSRLHDQLVFILDQDKVNEDDFILVKGHL